MGRLYTIPMIGVSIAAVQDLFTVLAATGKPLAIHEVRLGQSNEAGDANEDDWSFKFQQLTTGYTAGSGGTAPAAVRVNPNDAAPGVAARINDTTIAVAGSGTITATEGDAWNIRVPYRMVWTPEERPIVPPGAAWNLTMTKTPKAATTVSGTLIVEELA